MLRYIQFYSKQIAKISVWQLIVIATIGTWLCLHFLRRNNQEMIEKRDLVIAADNQLRPTTEINDLLLDLRDYTFAHMNTQMHQPLQLVNTYNRDNAEHKKQAYEELVSEGTYRKAEEACQIANSVQRASCISDYVDRNTDGLDYQEPADIPAEDYQFLFIAPAWSPDLAGFSIIVALALWGVTITKLFGRRVDRYYQAKSQL